MVLLELMEYKVIEVYWRLSSGSGPGGTDSVSLQHWILRFGEAGVKLWLIVTDFVEYIDNERPLWDAYCVLIYGHLIGLEKYPVVQTVGVGKHLWRLVTKCALKVAGP